jgi:ribosomal protein S12 methylthiotransferase
MTRPHTVYLDSLGCEKNTVDSESALGLLLQRGFALVEDPEDAELIVVNTCGFLASAREESVQRLRELGERKGDGQLVAMGCLIQNRSHDVKKLIPAVDHILGVGQYEALAGLLGGASAAPPVAPEEAPYGGGSLRATLGSRHFAHLKIAEGCNQSCSFCTIPLLRGKQRSRSVDELVRESEQLVASGVTELVLIAQNSSAYGIDLPGQPRLPELCRELAQLDGLRWLRVMYAYPPMFTERLAEELYSIERVASYLDIPIQHASEPVLERMNRGYDTARLRSQIELLRGLRPDLMLRTTALMGFPGEQEEDVVRLLDFLAEIEFDHLATFRYSHEERAPSAQLEDDVAEGEKEDRLARVESLQWDIGLARKERWLGRDVEVVVDEIYDPQDEEAWRGVAIESGEDPRSLWADEAVAFGRSEGFCPEVDGGAWFSAEGLAVGDRLRLRYIGCGPHDFVGVAEGAVIRP